MTTEQIFQKKCELEKELLIALSTMTRKTRIEEIKTEMLELQSECNHHSSLLNYDFDCGKCPYCGKKVYKS